MNATFRAILQTALAIDTSLTAHEREIAQGLLACEQEASPTNALAGVAIPAHPGDEKGRTLRTAEAMRLLGYKDSTTFWQAVRRGGLPFVRVSARRALFRECDIEAWMEARTVGAPLRTAGLRGRRR
jgi:excisionase family DNA binding protein